jgi:hypothetical protein
MRVENSKTTKKIKKIFFRPFFNFPMLEYFQTRGKLKKQMKEKRKKIYSKKKFLKNL